MTEAMRISTRIMEMRALFLYRKIFFSTPVFCKEFVRGDVIK